MYEHLSRQTRCKEHHAKKLVIEKRLHIWNEIVERTNSDFEGNEEFYAFVSK